MVWQIILTIAVLVCSGVIFYLTKELNKAQRHREREPAALS